MLLRNVISGPSSAFRNCSANSGSRFAVARMVEGAQPTYVAALTRVPPTARIAHPSRRFVASSFSRRTSLTSFERATIFDLHESSLDQPAMGLADRCRREDDRGPLLVDPAPRAAADL